MLFRLTKALLYLTFGCIYLTVPSLLILTAISDGMNIFSALICLIIILCWTLFHVYALGRSHAIIENFALFLNGYK